MKTIAFSKARAHFKDLLDQVQAGESIQISRNGEIVAELVPSQAARDKYWSKREFRPLEVKSATLEKYFAEQKEDRF